MMLNVTAANATWCPMVRTTRNQVATFEECSDQRRVPEHCRCIANECAMWRWAATDTKWQDKVVAAPELGAGGKRVVNVPVQVPTLGYCGLAGVPAIAGQGTP